MEVHAVPFVSKIQVTWRDGGEEFTNSYRGHYADELLELLKDIARETNSIKSGQNKPAPEGSWTCSCGQARNTGRFCTECGQPKPAAFGIPGAVAPHEPFRKFFRNHVQFRC
jgi:hypothetical protein